MIAASTAPKLAIFDLDGTLIDSRDDIAEGVNHAREVVGLPRRPNAEIYPFIGEGAERLVSRALGSRADLLGPAIRSYLAYYEKHMLDHTDLFSGLRELLADAPCALAVNTNKGGDFARQLLADLGVANRFVVVAGADDGPRKPDPAGALRCLAAVGATPAEAVYIGDSVVDLETAAGAGIRFLAVTWGLTTEADLRAAGATTLVHTVDELRALLTGG